MRIRPVAILGGVRLDAVKSDKPTHKFDVTSKAVENGSSIADHMQEQPAELTITGVVVGADAPARLARIRQMQTSRQLVTYVNRVIFTQMALTNISTEHDAEVGNGFKFTINLRHVRRAVPAQFHVVAPAPVATKAMPPQNAGTHQVQATAKQANNKAADKRLASKVASHGASLSDGMMPMAV